MADLISIVIAQRQSDAMDLTVGLAEFPRFLMQTSNRKPSLKTGACRNFLTFDPAQQALQHAREGSNRIPARS
jgi:hypothetical protein